MEWTFFSLIKLRHLLQTDYLWRQSMCRRMSFTETRIWEQIIGSVNCCHYMICIPNLFLDTLFSVFGREILITKNSITLPIFSRMSTCNFCLPADSVLITQLSCQAILPNFDWKSSCEAPCCIMSAIKIELLVNCCCKIVLHWRLHLLK